MCQIAAPLDTHALYNKGNMLDFDVGHTPVIISSFRADDAAEPYSKQLRVHQSCKKSIQSSGYGSVFSPASRPRSRSSSIFKFLFPSKSRKKDKESPVSSPDDGKVQQYYLDETLLREKVIELDFATMVDMPHGVDRNEWLATHTMSFFEHINVLYGTVAEFCTVTSCATMTGPNNACYLWQDEKGKKVRCSASQYVDYVLTFCHKSLHDDLPTKYGEVFPTSWEQVVRKVFRLLYHVLAHIFHAHYRDLHTLGLVAHANSLTLHFLTFADCHRLLDDRDCDALADLHARLKAAFAAPPPALSPSRSGDVAIATVVADTMTSSSKASPVRSIAVNHVTS